MFAFGSGKSAATDSGKSARSDSKGPSFMSRMVRRLALVRARRNKLALNCSLLWGINSQQLPLFPSPAPLPAAVRPLVQEERVGGDARPGGGVGQQARCATSVSDP